MDGPQPARAPLGQVFYGVCDRNGIFSVEPCNFGYPRGRCSSFEEAAPDAVRFSIGRGAALCWVMEKNGSPVAFGRAEDINPASPLRAQADKFLEYMREKGAV